jgi:hypothetical protein
VPASLGVVEKGNVDPIRLANEDRIRKDHPQGRPECGQRFRVVVGGNLTGGPAVKSRTVLGLSFLWLLAVAAPARADFVTVTLDTPDVVVEQPGSGSVTVDFTGTISFAAGFSDHGASLDYAFQGFDAIATTFGPVDRSAANDGHSVSGVLFTATIDATTPLGVYDTNLAHPGLPIYSVDASNLSGDIATGVATFRITVIRSVPEPASLALVGIGGLGAMALALRRRAMA